jgi:flagellar biosynthetic protein FlhB
MADDSEQDEKTERASERRLRAAWENGDIAVARDIGMLATLGAGGAILAMVGAGLRDSLVILVRASADGLTNPSADRLVAYLSRPALITLLVPTAVAIAVFVVFGIQTRLGLWPELTFPDFSRVFSAGRLKRLFQKDMVIDLAVAAVKVVTLGWALWSAFGATFLSLPRMLLMTPAMQVEATYRPLSAGLAKILSVVALLAGVDLAITRLRYLRRMKMTKDELKRDHRDEEGDPMIRARRRRKHRELAKGLVKVEVPRADALVVNPTHIAIAIRYRPGEDSAPRVTAKGKGQLAEIMRDLARQHGIPIVEDIPLARLLYRRVKVGRCVPMETFKAVAAILAYVYRVLGRNPMRAAAGGAR